MTQAQPPICFSITVVYFEGGGLLLWRWWTFTLKQLIAYFEPTYILLCK